MTQQKLPARHPYSLKKEERICSRKLIERLFGGREAKPMTAFPIRMVYLVCGRESAEEPQARILVSVPKRQFKRAVKRNRVKRQLREAYRKNKHLLLDGMAAMPEKTIAIAFVWTDNNLRTTAEVEQRVIRLLTRLRERVCRSQEEPPQGSQERQSGCSSCP